MYTFYIGQYVETGLPPLTMIEKCSKIKFEKKFKRTFGNFTLRHGCLC